MEKKSIAKHSYILSVWFHISPILFRFDASVMVSDLATQGFRLRTDGLCGAFMIPQKPTEEMESFHYCTEKLWRVNATQRTHLRMGEVRSGFEFSAPQNLADLATRGFRIRTDHLCGSFIIPRKHTEDMNSFPFCTEKLRRLNAIHRNTLRIGRGSIWI